MDMGPTHRHQEEMYTHLLAPTVVPVGTASGVRLETEWPTEPNWTDRIRKQAAPSEVET